MELGAQPRRWRRRHRGPVSAGCGRPGSPVPAPSLLGSGPRGCPGGGQARAGPPQPHGQVKLLHRAWCARAGGGAHCGPRRRPASCLAAGCILLAGSRVRSGFPPSWRGPATVLTRTVSWPSGPGAAGGTLPRCGAGARHPGCRWRRGLCSRPTHDARGCPASGIFTSLPASRASPASLPAPRARRPGVRPSPSLASTSPRLCAQGPPEPGAPLLPGCGPARLPASADWLGSLSAGKGVGQPARGAPRSRFAWMGRARETFLRAAAGAAAPGSRASSASELQRVENLSLYVCDT